MAIRYPHEVIFHAEFSLVPLAKGHEELLVELYTDAKVMAKIAPPYSREKAEAAFEQLSNPEAKNPSYLWVITQTKSPTIYLGVAALQCAELGAELGIMLLPPWCNKGFSVAVLAGVLDYAFNAWPLERVWAKHQISNEAVVCILTSLFFECLSTENGLLHWELRKEHWLEKKSKHGI